MSRLHWPIGLACLLLCTSLAQGVDLHPLSSAQVCGRCHRAIVDAWKQSAHSQAMESELFQDALDNAESDFGASTRKTCLACHSPTAAQNDDLSLQKKISWEGVTCDYCHSIRSVSIEKPNP